MTDDTPTLSAVAPTWAERPTNCPVCGAPVAAVFTNLSHYACGAWAEQHDGLWCMEPKSRCANAAATVLSLRDELAAVTAERDAARAMVVAISETVRLSLSDAEREDYARADVEHAARLRLVAEYDRLENLHGVNVAELIRLRGVLTAHYERAAAAEQARDNLLTDNSRLLLQVGMLEELLRRTHGYVFGDIDDTLMADIDAALAGTLSYITERDRLAGLLEQALPVLRRVWAQYAPHGTDDRLGADEQAVLQAVNTLVDDVEAAVGEGV